MLTMWGGHMLASMSVGLCVEYVFTNTTRVTKGPLGGNMVDVDKIIQYEDGQLDDDEIIEMFQDLVDSGQVWTLQGSYGRMARDMIELGLVSPYRKP